jgi:UDP-N-acetylmuramate--alanine ligase
MKIRTGIFFGGSSREREISFAGGRTVYDNLNKSIFEPIPVFVDSFGNLILLKWEYIYKGSIRDFYPPLDVTPPSANDFQVYAESLGDLSRQEQLALINKIGSRIEPSQLPAIIDFAFLCLHGSDGEDGRMQGLLELLRIPYSGSGILSSAIGMNKSVQKNLMQSAGFQVPSFQVIKREEWLTVKDKAAFFSKLSPSFPCVIKSANQGSSIGLSSLAKPDVAAFIAAVDKSFFIREIKKPEWNLMDHDQKVQYIRTLADIREGTGMPVKIAGKIIYHPEELLSVIIQLFSEDESTITIQALDGESEVMIESFIEGKEFSCIVIENTDGSPVALPPTEIKKGKEVFDYRSKYLPGLSRKITPINLPSGKIESIRKECERLFTSLFFNVYARIDGFISNDGTVLLNDPNTTSGMLPSSFFFHQAAEIGLNPSQFLTYIIRTSIISRLRDFKYYATLPSLLNRLNEMIKEDQKAGSGKIKVGVIMGGYSSERHISVESGRNIYEKLASSEKYEPIPVFLQGNEQQHQLFRIPVNILLKDNADDIKEKIEHYQVHEVIGGLIEKCKGITGFYATKDNLASPEIIDYPKLKELVDIVFIALHGRPGEDGVIQQQLDRLNIPYNGSGVATSQITIDKFRTNEILLNNGLLTASHLMVFEEEWVKNKNACMENITGHFKFPFIAKPVDDGCSSAVKKIKSREELEAFASLIFRKQEELDEASASLLKIKPKEEFPVKRSFLIEELITAEKADRFLEVTGGMITSYDDKGRLVYELFDASETLSEGDVLSLEEKFLAGQGQNITPARYSKSYPESQVISDVVKKELEKAARLLNIQGYARIDAFVRIYGQEKVEVIFIEVNSLPGMTPATCIFHQAALNNYKPYEFIDKILDFGFKRKNRQLENTKS